MEIVKVSYPGTKRYVKIKPNHILATYEEADDKYTYTAASGVSESTTFQVGQTMKEQEKKYIFTYSSFLLHTHRRQKQF